MGVNYDLILARRSQMFDYSREAFYRYALEYMQSARPVFFLEFFLWARLTIIELVESLWSVGERFRHWRHS